LYTGLERGAPYCSSSSINNSIAVEHCEQGLSTVVDNGVIAVLLKYGIFVSCFVLQLSLRPCVPLRAQLCAGLLMTSAFPVMAQKCIQQCSKVQDCS
jgi:hypothetical protein